MVGAVVLLSGGIDSAVALAERIERFPERTRVLIVDYGQRHSAEIHAAVDIAEHYGVPNQILKVNLRKIVEVSLTGAGDVPVQTLGELREQGLSPVYIPGRNTILISLGLACAEQYNLDEVVIGANQDDALGFPDCRPSYIAAWNALAAVATSRPRRVAAPHLCRTKKQVVSLGFELGVPFELTVSCYQADGKRHCGRCGACSLRKESFVGWDDPTLYLADI